MHKGQVLTRLIYARNDQTDSLWAEIEWQDRPPLQLLNGLALWKPVQKLSTNAGRLDKLNSLAENYAKRETRRIHKNAWQRFGSVDCKIN